MFLELSSLFNCTSLEGARRMKMDPDTQKNPRKFLHFILHCWIVENDYNFNIVSNFYYKLVIIEFQ